MNIKMTCEEAIEEIRSCLGVNNIIEPYSDEMIAFGMAIEALEKQIPKKPYFEADGYADGELVYDSFICPNCGMNYEYYDDTYQIEHCSSCGQALDFGGVNEV